VLFVSTLNAQQVRVEATLDTAKLRIGEQAKVDLYVTYDASLGNLNITWPTIGDTITSKIEVIEVSAIDTTFPNKTNSRVVHQHQQITISVYDSGFFAVPPLKFLVNEKDSMYTSPLFFEVHTLPVDTAAGAYKDIKEPFKEEFNWKWYLPTIITIIAIYLVLQIAVLIYLRFFRKKKVGDAVPGIFGYRAVHLGCYVG
jgi:ABC-type Fe3+-siderophore transport system permease subunit